jgi:hypothetical protein
LCGEVWKEEALNLLAFEDGDRRDSRVLAEDEAIWKDFRAELDAISCFSAGRNESVTQERDLLHGLDGSNQISNGTF